MRGGEWAWIRTSEMEESVQRQNHKGGSGQEGSTPSGALRATLKRFRWTPGQIPFVRNDLLIVRIASGANPGLVAD